ncbi:514_t:CDS:10 [Acaulospora morrowiae]|uniref:514_t:CDS:1 n=1 Tax=Acaulospora morrowiae TaxID=94023 RepID=A0A9N8W072_9GLOM|nr:514_t:CDS:10 [Acaulospora morrowiae]
MLYRKALDSFPENHKQAQECIQGFDVNQLNALWRVIVECVFPRAFLNMLHDNAITQLDWCVLTEKIEKSSESVEAFWFQCQRGDPNYQHDSNKADGILHMFKATNQSQQHVTNIQHQDLGSLYPSRDGEDKLMRILKRKERDGYTTPCPITNSLEDNLEDESRSKRRVLAKTDDDSYKSDEHDESGDSNEESDEESEAKNSSLLFKSYRSEALSLAQEFGLSVTKNYREILSLSHVLLLQTDDYSDMQIKKFSRDTLEDLRKDTRSKILGKEKLSKDIKSILQEYVEIALDDDGGLIRLRKSIIESYSKAFNTPEELELFQKMQLLFQQLASNIPIHLSKEKISEGTLISNIISPVLRIFFHDVSVYPTIWPNTSSSSAKVRKLANNDPSRAKQPDMIGNVLHNGRFAYEMMYGEVTGEGKNNTEKKNLTDLIRLGIFMKDSLDNILQKTGVNSIVFAWQSIVTKWTGYFMILIATGVYIMVDAGNIELPRSFEICSMFLNGLDILRTFQIAYDRASKKVFSAISKDKEDSENVELKTWCRSTLGTPEFKKITKIK